MRATPKIRRQSWKPRTRFAKAKPRLKRGSIKLRKGNLCDNPKAKGLSIRANSLGKICETAAAGQRAGRRVKPKRETPRTIHPERSRSGHKRERLHGKARELRRAEIFTRAEGRCEELIGGPIVVVQSQTGPLGIYLRCNRPATQWSHARHAANKCDCYSPTAQGACSIASCDDCHDRRHNPKPITVTKKSLKERTHAV